MTLQEGESIEGFQLIEQKEISEIEGLGRIFYHEKSGVTVISLENKDPHKVFSINFLTLPEDNKGTAHIIEHAVCCASKKYPLKETFMAAGQGSICTTMNACTYPDRTMYYAASPHEKDLLGIAEVYLDLVFHPCIEDSNKYFLQEGWHYELEGIDDPLEISGVVYHEMLSEYGEAGSFLMHNEMESLFPDTVYQYDSGGIPEEIIKLTEKEFLDFYHKYYQGSNAVITVYGDGNIETILKHLNQNGLQDVSKGNAIQPVASQRPFEKPQYRVSYYPTALNKAPTLLSMSFVVGESTDCELRLAFEILEHMLIRSTASPLLKTLIMEQNLGMSLSDGGYDSCRKQPVFTITLKGCEKESAEKFESAVLQILTELVEQGIDPKLIDAAVETLEFELRETDASYEPIGIVYSEMILSSYLYGGKAFNHLCYRQPLEHIKQQKNKGYFEDLIKTYLLDNPHRLLTVLIPSEKMQQEKEQIKFKALDEYKNKLSKKELFELIELNESLEEEQLQENDEALLKTLPQLSLADMPHTLPKFKLQQLEVLGQPLLFHEESTKGIAYIHLLWNASHIKQKDLKTLGLLAHLFTYVGTENMSYGEVENAINTYTGGMNSAIHAYKLEGKERIQPIFKISCKVLESQLSAFISLMTELLLKTHFNEKEKLKELIGHIVYELERSFTGAPEYRASQRIYTYLSEQGVYEDEVSGMAFYEYIKEVYTHFDIHYGRVAQELGSVMKELFQIQYLKLSITASSNQKDTILYQLKKLISQLPRGTSKSSASYVLEKKEGNEGFYNGQDGQAVAYGFCFADYGYEYHGQYEVIANILENTYLWDRVRLQGGAYGCDIMLSKEGYLVICSYCDPHLRSTLDIYNGIGDYLKELQLSQETIERAIISTLGAMLAPISMEQKSERACMYFLTEMTQEKRQMIYDEIRQTTIADFHQMSQLFEQMNLHGQICVMGNKDKLLKQKGLLKLIDLQI